MPISVQRPPTATPRLNSRNDNKKKSKTKEQGDWISSFLGSVAQRRSTECGLTRQDGDSDKSKRQELPFDIISPKVR